MKNKKKALLTIREIAIFGMLGGLMYASKILMNAFPNVHFIGVSIMAITLVYRWKALFPIYVFVLIHGFVEGFSAWWVPYLYIWSSADCTVWHTEPCLLRCMHFSSIWILRA